ncbi:putative DUR3-urea permease [Ceraceosorus guamensis]|uniref:Putative DUR3-urea permease n=1 Tax=Ceraceosorus guamensis TaxID=1522189 RepID=A0A316W4B9_9BASI|nr:putative DUR3-urea permease [Ceraceosorus guamensis]PWN44394.1 putative DUR3-urea permease [Ceraceosorus guamensis]
MSTAGSPPPPLTQGAGYGVIVGLGALFAIVVIGISNGLHRFGNIKRTSAEYAIASRSLGVGLTAAGAVSGWTWSVTLLSSCSTAYNYGVAGAMLYGASNMSQIALFSLMAVRFKQKVPQLHTHLELLRLRYGTLGHLTFLFFALATNILVCSSVLVGAAAAITSITGINTYAALVLLPVAVAAYTLRAGLRGTILADYLHTVIIFIILFVFFIVVYGTGSEIGSAARMWELLTEAGNKNPSANYNGSFLTMKSIGGIEFQWLSLLEYTGVVFNDASFHQKALAAGPDTVVPGYLLGSLSWFSIPWALATTAGLSALALETTSPAFPTYPRRMSESEVSAGLVLPYAANAVLGKGGSAGVLLLMFMSSTSAVSAQLIAVSSIIGYDIYKTYFNRKATPDQILRSQQYGVIGFTAFIAAFGCLLQGVGADLGLLYNITGVWSCAALPQLVFSFWQSRTPKWTAFPGIWIGFFAGLAVWLSLAKRLEGGVNVTTLAEMDPNIYAFATSIATGTLLCTIGSIFFPSDFQWESISVSSAHGGQGGETVDEKELKEIEEDARWSKENLQKWLVIALVSAFTIFVVMVLIWPLSLYRDYTFPLSFFGGWVWVSFAWSVIAFIIVGLYPLYEGLPILILISKGVYARLAGKPNPTTASEDGAEEKSTQLTAGQGRDASGESEPTTPIDEDALKARKGSATGSDDSPAEEKPAAAPISQKG